MHTEQSDSYVSGILSRLFGPDYVKNPYPLLKEIREHDPFFMPPGVNNWIIRSY
ncbi:MAG: hypothetical protein ACI89U_003359 [Gammaproteobacteria bacterium]|jgi:hypothetical protein